MLRAAFIAAALISGTVALIAAGPLEDAQAAFDRRDYETSVRLFRDLAEQGNAEAQGFLGLIYIMGEGVQPDHAEALKWLRMSAGQGHAEMQNLLGGIFFDGVIVAQDFAEAVKWYRLAAEQGVAEAQESLGFIYLSGYGGVAPDHAEAVKWNHMAAEQGEFWAQARLGKMYEEGDVVQQDLVLALKWFILAEANGIPTDLGDQDRVEKQMTAEQILEAQRLARDWKPK